MKKGVVLIMMQFFCMTIFGQSEKEIELFPNTGDITKKEYQQFYKSNVTWSLLTITDLVTQTKYKYLYLEFSVYSTISYSNIILLNKKDLADILTFLNYYEKESIQIPSQYTELEYKNDNISLAAFVYEGRWVLNFKNKRRVSNNSFYIQPKDLAKFKENIQFALDNL